MSKRKHKKKKQKIDPQIVSVPDYDFSDVDIPALGPLVFPWPSLLHELRSMIRHVLRSMADQTPVALFMQTCRAEHTAWVSQRNLVPPGERFALRYAIALWGHYELLECFYSRKVTPRVLEYAASNGQVSLLQRVYNEGRGPRPSRKALALAIAGGHLDTVKWIVRQVRGLHVQSYTIHQGIEARKWVLVCWLAKHMDPALRTGREIIAVLEAGETDVVDRLFDLGFSARIVELKKAALCAGTLESLRWIVKFKIRFEGEDLSFAIRRRLLTSIRILVDELDFPLSNSHFWEACCDSGFEIAEFIISRIPTVGLSDELVDMCLRHKWHVKKLLVYLATHPEILPATVARSKLNNFEQYPLHLCDHFRAWAITTGITFLP